MATPTQPLRGEAAGSSRRQPAPRAARRVVRRQAVVRRLDPWSVLKLSLIFYLFLLLVVLLGLAVVWALVDQLGVIDEALQFLELLDLPVVALNMGSLARAVFFIGLLQVVFLTALNVFMAFLYNLVSDLLGGLKITLAEEQRWTSDPSGQRGGPGGAATIRSEAGWPTSEPTLAEPRAQARTQPVGTADGDPTQRLH